MDIHTVKCKKLKATLTTEQAELFEKYYIAANEMNSVSEATAFKFGFNLAVRLLTESTKQHLIGAV